MAEPMRKIGLTAVGVMLALSGARAQQTPVFRGGVDLVTVDVVVLDTSGGLVRGLTAGDFTVLAAGTPRRLVSVEYVRAVGDPSPAPTPSRRTNAAIPTPGPTSNVRSGPAGRTIIFAVDVEEIRAGEGRAAMKSIADHVDRLGPDDRVGLVSLPYGTPLVEVTTNRALVVEAAGRIAGASTRGRGALMSYGEAAGVARRDTQALLAYWERVGGTTQVLDPEVICDPPRRRPFEEPTSVLPSCAAAADRVLDAYRRHTRAILDMLGGLADAMAPIEGPKALVLVSEGLFGDVETAGDLDRFARIAERTRVSLYALHLHTPLMEAAAAGPSVRSRLLDDRVGFDGMADVAYAARGTALRVTGSAAGALAQIDRELEGYYLLSFEREPTDRDGAHVGIEVRVNRAGLDVRARREFTPRATPPATPAPATPKDARAAIGDLLSWPVAIRELRIDLDTFVQPVPESASDARVLVVSELTHAGRPLNALGYEIRDERQRVVADTLDAPPSLRPIDDRRSLYIVAQPLEPGRYRLKLGVTDEDGRRGSLEHAFEVARWTPGQLRVSDLILGEVASGTFRPTANATAIASRLGARIEVHADAPSAFADLAVELIVERRGGSGMVRLTPVLAASNDSRNMVAATVALDVLDYPQGQYDVTVILRSSAGEVARRARSFTR